MRISLGEVDAAVVRAMEAWLPAALVGGSTFDGGCTELLLQPPDGSTARCVLVAGRPIGYVAFQLHARDVAITALAVDPVIRNRGFGAEAVFSVEQAATTALRARALVPLANGLAVYFWLRIGYHPQFAVEHGRSGVTMMERELHAP